jgi:hypothetical protein
MDTRATSFPGPRDARNGRSGRKRGGRLLLAARPRNYMALTLSTVIESPSTFPVTVTFLPATSFTLS